MRDIGAELQKSIENAFNEHIASDYIIAAISKKVEGGNASQRDVVALCKRLGDIATKILQDNIKPDSLPGGKMYWNIASKAIKPLMIRVHTIVNRAAVEVLETERNANGISIKAIVPPFPEERIEALINNFVKAYNAEVIDEEGSMG